MRENLDEEVDKALLFRFVAKGTSNYPQRAVHIFTENNPVGSHNETMLEVIDPSFVYLNEIDGVPKGWQFNESQLVGIKKRKLSDTGNLTTLRKLKTGASVMLTVNVNLEDRLVNRLVGVDMDFRVASNKVKIVFVKFEDEAARENCNAE